jgi:hypothetical protein
MDREAFDWEKLTAGFTLQEMATLHLTCTSMLPILEKVVDSED